MSSSLSSSRLFSAWHGDFAGDISVSWLLVFDPVQQLSSRPCESPDDTCGDGREPGSGLRTGPALRPVKLKSAGLRNIVISIETIEVFYMTIQREISSDRLDENFRRPETLK